jgi:hypothetical protein
MVTAQSELLSGSDKIKTEREISRWTKYIKDKERNVYLEILALLGC